MLNIIIPIGEKVFLDPPYEDVPLMLHNIQGKPILHWAMEHLEKIPGPKKYIILAPQELERKYSLSKVFSYFTESPIDTMFFERPTQGMPCSVLMAIEMINPDEEVLVSSIDQYMDVDLVEHLDELRKTDAAAAVFNFESLHPKWSYAITDADHNVCEIQEKNPISTKALASLYWFRKAHDMFEAIKDLIRRGERVNGRFFLAPSLNELILRGSQIKSRSIDEQKYFNFYDGHQVSNFAEYLKNRTEEEKHQEVALTYEYIRLFNEADVRGLENIFTQDMSLEDPFIRRIEGRDAVMNVLGTLFKENPDLKFTPKKVSALSGEMTLIEFTLTLGDKTFIGVDLIQWENSKIKALRAYLHEDESAQASDQTKAA